MNKNQWARFRYRLITTGTYDPDDWYEMDGYQRDWTKDTLATMKAIMKGEGSSETT